MSGEGTRAERSRLVKMNVSLRVALITCAASDAIWLRPLCLWREEAGISHHVGEHAPSWSTACRHNRALHHQSLCWLTAFCLWSISAWWEEQTLLRSLLQIHFRDEMKLEFTLSVRNTQTQHVHISKHQMSFCGFSWFTFILNLKTDSSNVMLLLVFCSLHVRLSCWRLQSSCCNEDVGPVCWGDPIQAAERSSLVLVLLLLLVSVSETLPLWVASTQRKTQ